MEIVIFVTLAIVTIAMARQKTVVIDGVTYVAKPKDAPKDKPKGKPKGTNGNGKRTPSHLVKLSKVSGYKDRTPRQKQTLMAILDGTANGQSWNSIATALRMDGSSLHRVSCGILMRMGYLPMVTGKKAKSGSPHSMPKRRSAVNQLVRDLKWPKGKVSVAVTEVPRDLEIEDVPEPEEDVPLVPRARSFTIQYRGPSSTGKTNQYKTPFGDSLFAGMNLGWDAGETAEVTIRPMKAMIKK